MKKKISLILALTLSLSIFTGCNAVKDDEIAIQGSFDDVTTVDVSNYNVDIINDSESDYDIAEAVTTAYAEVTTAPQTEVTTTIADEVLDTLSPSINIDNINATLKWKETKIKETFVINQACYSRKYPIVGSATVNKYKKGVKITTVAATDTGYYKIADGEFIHADYLTETTDATTAKTTKTTTTTTVDEFVTTTDSEIEYNTTGAIKTNYKTSYKTRYAYKTLSTSEKKFYANLVNAYSNFANTCSVPDGLTKDQMVKVYSLVYTQEPQLFWMSSKFNSSAYTVRLQYLISDKATAQKAQDKIDAQAATIMKKVNAASDTFNKIKVIHDYVVLSTDFEFTGDGYGSCIYNSMLGTGGTQCNGYAKTFNYLCDLAGIECMVITGTNPAGLSHAWNKVYCDDGYYNLDCTWDDPNNDHDSNYIRYVFLLVPDAWIKNSHLNPCTITRGNGDVITCFKAPSATKTTYNYFNVAKKTYSTLATAEKALYAEIDAAIKAGKNTVHIRVDNKELYDKMMSNSKANSYLKYCKNGSTKVKTIARQRRYMEETYVVQYDIFYK